MKTIKKGALYYVDAVNGRKKPVVIVQDMDQRWGSKTILIAPISTIIIENKKPTYIQVPQFNKIRKNSYILIEKIHPIIKSELQGYIGMLDKEQIEEMNFLLRVLFEL